MISPILWTQGQGPPIVTPFSIMRLDLVMTAPLRLGGAGQAKPGSATAAQPLAFACARAHNPNMSRVKKSPHMRPLNNSKI